MDMLLNKVLTVTPNPALDITVQAEHWQRNCVNQGQYSTVTPGGKGVNVALNLSQYSNLIKKPLSVSVTGWLGHDNDSVFTEVFSHNGINDAFIRLAGNTRYNIKLIETASSETTDINLPGLTVKDSNQQQLWDYLNDKADKQTLLVLSGSLPSGVDSTFYRSISERYRQQYGRIIIDTSAMPLQLLLNNDCLPHILKPNIHELREACQGDLANQQDIIPLARQWMAKGLELLVVSMGKQGAWFITPETAIQATPSSVNVASTVGAGDAMVAGICYSLLRSYSLEKTARFSTALSAANIESLGAGITNLPRLEALAATVKITNLS